MNDPATVEAILADYEAKREHLEQFTEIVRRLIDDLVEPLRGDPIKRIHLVDGRLKSRGRLKSKLERIDRNDKTLADITDVCGARVITYYADDVDRVGTIIEREFEIDLQNSVDKRDLLDPDRFGYLSLHYVASLSPARAALAEYAPFAGEKIEIQVRSVLQHGWAEIERGLGYRNKTLPGAVRRRFSMLAGLLEMADNEFAAIREDLRRHRAEVVEGVKLHPESVPIDRDSVRAYVMSSPDVGRLDHQLAEIRNATVVESDDRTFDLRAVQLQAAGLTMIGEVDTAIIERSPQILEFARIWLETAPQVASVKAGYSLFFLCYLIAAKHRSAEDVAKYLKSARITRLAPPSETIESVAARVLEVYGRVFPGEPRR